jgi:hypothetical protein
MGQGSFVEVRGFDPERSSRLVGLATAGVVAYGANVLLAALFRMATGPIERGHLAQAAAATVLVLGPAVWLMWAGAHNVRARARPVALLIDANVIETSMATTRGGRVVPVIVPTDQRLRKRAVADAAGRKRLLQTRFLIWASGSAGIGTGVVGKAGEAAVHAGLTAAAPYGYRLVNPATGQVTRLLDQDLTFGSLDNAAFLTTVDQLRFVPTGQYIVLVEVKNIRSWIYRSTAELYQLLHKAARLQVDHPDQRFLPVLICGRAKYMVRRRSMSSFFQPRQRLIQGGGDGQSWGGGEVDRVDAEQGGQRVGGDDDPAAGVRILR